MEKSDAHLNYSGYTRKERRDEAKYSFEIQRSFQH